MIRRSGFRWEMLGSTFGSSLVEQFLRTAYSRENIGWVSRIERQVGVCLVQLAQKSLSQ